MGGFVARVGKEAPLNAEIIAIGTEILFGEIVDTNSAYMAAELAKLGIEVHWVSKVGRPPR